MSVVGRVKVSWGQLEIIFGCRLRHTRTRESMLGFTMGIGTEIETAHRIGLYHEFARFFWEMFKRRWGLAHA
jgi:hypothetical protein